MGSRKLWLWMIPVLLVAFWLGARQVDSHPLWGDEINSLTDARGNRNHPFTIPQIWENIGQNNPWQAPGYFMVLGILAPIVDWNPPILRVYPLLIGILGIAWTYRLGRDSVSPLVGVIAAILLTVSAIYVRYLYELRVYSLLALESAFIVWAYLRVVNDSKPLRRRMLLALFLGTAAAFYSHYFAAVPIVALGLYHLLFVPKNRRWWLVTAALTTGALVFLPWIPYLIAGVGKAATEQRRDASAWEIISIFFNRFSNGVVPVSGLLLISFASFRRWPYRRNAALIVFIAIFSLLGLIFINRFAHVISDRDVRYLMPLWPLFTVIVAIGIAQLQRWPLIAAVTLLLCIAVGLHALLFSNFLENLAGSQALFPVQHVADMLEKDRAQNGDMVVHYLSNANAVTDNTYAGVAGLYYSATHTGAVMAMGTSRPRNEESLVAKLKTYGRVWIAYMPDDRPSSLDVLISDLAGDFRHCGTLTERADVTVDLYARNDILCPNNPGLYLDDRVPD